MPVNPEYVDQFGRATILGRNQRRLQNRGSGPWHIVGDPGEPAFQNGWGPPGGGLISLKYRWHGGGGTDIKGSADGGSSATIVFDLPAGYFDTDGEEQRVGNDATGAPITIRIVPATVGGVSLAHVYFGI